MNRRDTLKSLFALGLSASALQALAKSTKSTKAPHILWRNGWNINNIGDIGHVPGALALLRHYIPEAKVTLWAHSDMVFRDKVAQMAGYPSATVNASTVSRKVMPGFTLVTGTLDDKGTADNAALEAAVASADIMVIGSGAGILEPVALMRFHQRTKKPIGMFGITTDSFNFTYFNDGENSPDVKAMRAASFVFTRDKTSLRLLAGEDVDGPGGALKDDPNTPVNEAINRSPITQDLRKIPSDFVPDTTFAFAVRDDKAAQAFMQAKGLESGKFICVVPRHRWTPTGTPTRQGDSRDTYNALYFKTDHDKLRAAIIDYVRTTGNKVAVVPETIYVISAMGPLIKDGLPDDVAAKVVVRDGYWLPDEAASVFAHAQAVISLENHSPIIAAVMGTPFIMVHQIEDSFKGDMFRDIGLGDWYVQDINTATGAEISAILQRIVKDMPAAKAKLAKAMLFVKERQKFGMDRVRRTLGLSPLGKKGYPKSVFR